MSPFIQNIITNFEWNVYSDDGFSTHFLFSVELFTRWHFICQRMYSQRSYLPPIVYWKGKIIAYKWIEARDQMNRWTHIEYILLYKLWLLFLLRILRAHTLTHTFVWWCVGEIVINVHKKWETVNKLWHFIEIEVKKKRFLSLRYNRKCILALQQRHKALCILKFIQLLDRSLKREKNSICEWPFYHCKSIRK